MEWGKNGGEDLANTIIPMLVASFFFLICMLSSEIKGIFTVVSTISFAALSRCSNGKLLISFFYWCGYCLYK